MTRYVSTHALERAIASVSHGALVSLEARRAALAYDSLQELTIQYQTPIAGHVSTAWGWTKFTIGFDVEFVYAPQQRDSPFTVPHFNTGVVVQGEPYPLGTDADPDNPDSCVVVQQLVLDWARDPTRSIITGAVVAVGVHSGGTVDISYDGYVHWSFQGFASVAGDDVPQLDVGL